MARNLDGVTALYDVAMISSRNPLDVFCRIARTIGELFAVRVVCLSQIDGDELQFVSVYVDGQILKNAGRCPLRVTPCASVQADKDLRIYDHVAERFPDASFLKDHEAFSYCGFPSLDSEGNVIAVACLLDDKPHEFTKQDQELLRILGQRIGAELERNSFQQKSAAAEDAAKALERRMDAILTIAPEAIIVTDNGTNIEIFNEGASAIFGYEPQEVIGQPLAMLIPERLRRVHDAHIEQFRSAREVSRTMGRRTEVTGLRKNGEEFLAEASISKVMTDGKQLFTAIVRDITERKRVERALIDARRAAELANQAKSRFLTTMSHELRTPLNAVIGFSDILCRQLHGPVGNKKYLDYARDIYESGKHLDEMVSSILEMSRLSSGSIDLREEPIDVLDLLQNCLKKFIESASRRQVRLLPDFSAEGLPRLRADRELLARALSNLLSNAVKFTPKGGEVRLRAWATPDSGFVFQIIDTGIGIAEDDIPKVFSRFEQLDADLNRRYEGTGLGLPLAKSLVELHGGSLDLQSQVDVGTTVTIRLPARRIATRAA